MTPIQLIWLINMAFSFVLLLVNIRNLNRTKRTLKEAEEFLARLTNGHA